MAISERTYTFRASADLGDRKRDASHVLAELAAQPGSRLTERISREVGMTIARRGGLAGTGLTGENQSAFLREIVELIVHAAQKVANDIACLPEGGRPERYDFQKLAARLKERLPQVEASKD